jgi:hypothetical protein
MRSIRRSSARHASRLSRPRRGRDSQWPYGRRCSSFVFLLGFSLSGLWSAAIGWGRHMHGRFVAKFADRQEVRSRLAPLLTFEPMRLYDLSSKNRFPSDFRFVAATHSLGSIVFLI